MPKFFLKYSKTALENSSIDVAEGSTGSQTLSITTTYSPLKDKNGIVGNFIYTANVSTGIVNNNTGTGTFSFNDGSILTFQLSFPITEDNTFFPDNFITSSYAIFKSGIWYPSDKVKITIKTDETPIRRVLIKW